MKNGIKKKIILLLIIFTTTITTLISLSSTSYGSTQTVGSLTWSYDVVDGEAVNVYISSGTPGYRLTIPSTLGGYPVTKISDGESGYNITGSWDGGEDVTIIELPSTLKVIGKNTFRNFNGVAQMTLPEGLEKIEESAFSSFGRSDYGTFTIPDSVTNIEDYAFSSAHMSELVIGSGLTTIGDIVSWGNLKSVNIPNTVTKMNYTSFSGIKDVYIDNTEDNIEILGERKENDEYSSIPYIHFPNEKETISTNVLDGIKVIDTATNEEFTSKDFDINSNVTIKIENNSNINNYMVIIESDPDYYGREHTFQKVTLDQNNTYTFENITRNKKIYVQEEKQGMDLALRQFITRINNTEIGVSREPQVEIKNGVINYIQSKLPVYVGKNNTIQYTIRVYNEGNTRGCANKIKYFIPQGLKYNYLSLGNMSNRWEVSEDGTYVTTEALKNQYIYEYSGVQNIQYKDITIELLMDEDVTYDMERIVSLAEIMEGSSQDADSTFGNIDTIVDSSYMAEESLIPNSYIHGQDDDNDFEVVTLSNSIETKYNLRINKIDELNNVLLNGATFELLDEDMEVLKTGVTANGGVLDFGLVEAFAPGNKRYYIREIYTPEGYKNCFKYLIQVTVITELENGSEPTSRVELSLEDIDIDTSKYQTIEVSSKDEFMAMQSNQNAKYILTQNIDLDGVEWTPMNLENVMLDGNNHKISNLTIEVDESTNKKVGLFSTYSGIIENLTLDNVNIKVTKTAGEVTERVEDDIHAVGGIIGYSKGTIFKNCKVTGEVESEVDNVGGFVGHSKVGTLDVYRNCINEAEVSTTAKNAGGMIGTALGPVQIISSTNKGNVTTGMYNAGGMIGAAECQGYTTDKVIGEYTDDNKSIQITVKNERIQGNYKLKIEKVDAKDGAILTGAKFTLYDRTKNPIEGYENIELTDGTLEIPAVVEYIGTDTYYLKETEAPVGYEKITDEYIKIEITKTWNQVNEEYISTGTISVLSEEELELDTPKAYNSSDVATQSTYTKENTDVDWKLNKVSISKDSVNEGNISSETISAAGMIGRAQCDVSVTDSRNRGTITTKLGKAAGILADQQLTESQDQRTLYIKNASNIGNVEQKQEEGYTKPDWVPYDFRGDVAGIVAITSANVEIYNTANKGEVTSLNEMTHAAGILADSASDKLIIDGCVNEGNISASDAMSDVSGILARSVVDKEFVVSNSIPSDRINKHSNNKILNCTNKGDLTANKGYSGGIVGESATKTIEIYNCTSENASISGKGYTKGISSIAGGLNNDIITIDNCTVTGGSVIDNSEGYENCQVGGIVGLIQDQCSYSSKDKLVREVTINNANVKGLQINGKGNTGGIVGNIYCDNTIAGNYESDEKNIKVTIKNCDFEDSTVKSTGTNGTYEQIGGIVGYIHKGYLNIDKCNVKNSNVQLDSEGSVSGDSNVGGILGGTNVRYLKVVKITNCEVDTCDILNKTNTTYQGARGPEGGIGGSIWTDNLVVTNNNVKNSHLHADAAQIGGIVGVVFSHDINIKDCNVSDTIIDGEETVPNGGSEYAGIVAYANLYNRTDENSNGNINIEDCTIKDSTIYNKNSYAAGVISVVSYGTKNINNITIENTNIKSDLRYDVYSSGATAGIMGHTNSGYSITNAIVKDSIIEANGTSTAGILGSLYDSEYTDRIENCEINNTIIKNTLDDSSIETCSYTSTGGIVGYLNGGSIENCKVINNSQIISKMRSTGGIVGYRETGDIKDCSFENSTIKSETLINNKQNGEIGAIVGFTNGNIENCIVSNAGITANSEHVGGLEGQYYNYNSNINNIKNCSVDRLTITHNNSVEINEENYSNKTKNIGGAIGTNAGSAQIIDSTFNNITVNIVGTETTMHVGGLIGITNGNVEITNTNQENPIEIENIKLTNPTSGMTGGMIGFNTSLDEMNLSNMKLKNINVTGGYHTGGMIGSTAKVKLSDIVIEGIQAQETSTSATVGGLVGRIQKEYNDTSAVVPSIQINNVEVKSLNNRDNIIKAENGAHAGVLVGLAQGVELNTRANDKIKVSNTRVNSTASTAGLIGQTESINNISNIELENVRMISKDHAGGIIGQIATNWSSPNTNPITVSNVKATNVKATATDKAGGLIGINNSTAQLTVQNVELENIETKGDLHAGAVIGFTATSQAFNMSNVTAKHITSTASYDVGGLVGMTNNSTAFNVDNVTAEDLKITCADAKGEYNQNAGGIVSATPNPKFSNIHVKDININAQHLHNIGGLVGAATQMQSNSSQGAEFKNITIDASEGKTNIIQGTTTYYDSYNAQSGWNYGGILIGFVNQKAKVDGIIDIKNTTLRDNSEYYNNQSGFGGLIGFANEYENPSTITNSIALSNVTVIGTGRVGGIIGNVYTLSNMHDITLNNVNVDAINGYASAGLIGMAMKQQKGSGQDITFDVSNINVNGLTVNGNNGVQHIAGLVAFAPNVNVRQVVGENVTITGNAPNSIAGLVGIVAMYDDATNEELETEISDINLSNLTISSTTGTSNMGGLVAEAMKPRVKDVVLEDINITNNGNGSTAGVVGIVTSTYRTFTHTDLTSEGEFSNITIRKSEGAENSNKIIGTTNGNAAIISTIGKTTTNTIGTTSTIKVSDTDLQSNYGFAGIFGYAASGSDINNVIADNVHIIGGTSHAGVVAGQVQGNLSNCQVSNSSVINESGSGSFTGGLVGLKESAQPLANCSVTNTTVTSVSTYGIGGIAGLSKSPTSNCTITDSSVTSTANSMWAIGGAFGGVTNGDASDTTVTKCNAINTTVTAKSANAGGLIGLSDFAVSNSKVTDGTITLTASSDSTGGLVGRITSTGSIDGCDVIDTTVSTYGNYVGGMVGFANKTINSSNVVGSTIISNSTTALGVGGIVGHGSNMSGGDAVITGCKVMDTTITGTQKVGGIAGAAVSKIANCYVGEKEGSTYEEGQNAVTVTGTNSVGGIIGDPGVIYGDTYIMITMQGNNMNNVRINRNDRAREEGEDDIIFAMMGQHNRLADTYEPEEPRTETISANTASNCVLNINE